MKKEPTRQRYDAFLFFVLVALIVVFAVVTVMQIRVAQFDKRMSSVEGSVTRIENGMDELVGVVRRYERALDIPGQQDLGTEQVAVGDRREATK